MEAYDLGEPTTRSSSNRAQVRVDVVRNENRPLFFNASYDVGLRQDAGVGSQVVVVQAADADQAVSDTSASQALLAVYSAPSAVLTHVWVTVS